MFLLGLCSSDKYEELSDNDDDESQGLSSDDQSESDSDHDHSSDSNENVQIVQQPMAAKLCPIHNHTQPLSFLPYHTACHELILSENFSQFLREAQHKLLSAKLVRTYSAKIQG